MQRTKQSLPFIAGLVALSVAFLAPRPAQGAELNPSAWRFQVCKQPATSQIYTVLKAGGHGWFVATAASGKKVRVSLPPRFGWVQRAAGWMPTEQLRAGDRVEVSPVTQSSRVQAARVRLIDEIAAVARATSSGE
jgi:hypothetical protein